MVWEDQQSASVRVSDFQKAIFSSLNDSVCLRVDLLRDTEALHLVLNNTSSDIPFSHDTKISLVETRDSDTGMDASDDVGRRFFFSHDGITTMPDGARIPLSDFYKPPVDIFFSSKHCEFLQVDVDEFPLSTCGTVLKI